MKSTDSDIARHSIQSLRGRRTDKLDVGGSALDVGSQTVDETTRRRNDRNTFTARETQDYAPSQRQATNKQTLTLRTPTSKYSNEFTYSYLPCHL